MASDSDENLVKTIDQMCPVRRKLELKINTQVMLTKNVNVQKGLVNGARGVITGFESNATGLWVECLSKNKINLCNSCNLNLKEFTN